MNLADFEPNPDVAPLLPAKVAERLILRSVRTNIAARTVKAPITQRSKRSAWSEPYPAAREFSSVRSSTSSSVSPRAQ